MVTLTLIGLNVAVFVAMVVSGVSFFEPTPEAALRWGADFGPYTLTGGWWRIGSAMFLHFGIFHLALNMWALLNLGFLAEWLFGRSTFLALYLVSGVGGSLASLLVHPLVVGGGASGAIFGVAGGLIAGLLLKRESSELLASFPKSLPSLFSFVVWNLLGGLRFSGIDIMAHVGGLVTGAAFGAAVCIPMPRVVRGSVRLASTTAIFAIALDFVAVAVKRVDVAKLSAPPPDVGLPLSLTVAVPSLPTTGPSGLGEEIRLLEKVVAARPESIQAAIQLATAYLQVERFADALATLENARGRAPENTLVLTTLGTADLAAHRYDDAVAAYQAVFNRDSSDRDARYNLASAYLERAQSLGAAGEQERARADFAQVLRLRADTALDGAARHALGGAKP